MVHVIKVYLEDAGIGKPQIRRLAVSSDVVNKFDLLHEKVTNLFPTIGKAFEVAWKDPEGDLVQMASDAELAQALANAEDGLIKLYVSVIKTSDKQDEPKPGFSSHGIEVHPHTICDGCNVNICGHRYKCLQCRDFDLCSACNAANKHPEHDMIKLVRPNYIPREWVFSGARAMWRSMFGHCMRGFHQRGQPKEENNESSSSKEQKAPNAPSDKWQEAFSNILGGDFVPAEKFFQESIQNVLKFAGVEVKIEKCPFSNGNSKNKESKAETPNDQAQTKSENFENTMPEKAEESPKKDDDGIRVTAEPEKKDQIVNSESVNFDGGLFNPSGARPKESIEPSGVKVECESTENQQKEKTPESDASVLELSNGTDGWTLLNKEETVKKESLSPEHVTDDNTIPKASSSDDIKAKVTEEKEPAPKDPKVANALMKMRAMGFTNEGGWLERLLITKQGNINEALDALYPYTLRH